MTEIVTFPKSENNREIRRLHLAIGEKTCNFLENISLSELKDPFRAFPVEGKEKRIALYALDHFKWEYQRQIGEGIKVVPWENLDFQKGFKLLKQNIPVVKFFINRFKDKNFEAGVLNVDQSMINDKEVINGFVSDVRGLEVVIAIRNRIALISQELSTPEAKLGALLFEALYYQTVVSFSDDFLDQLVKLQTE